MKRNIKGPAKSVRTCRNLNEFKRIDGNRTVSPKRVAKIMASIKSRGFIGAIVVNEKKEIIDGQGRVEACRQLNLPVDYIMQPGLTIDDCIEMNIAGEPWTLRDYIDSYASRNIEDYVLLSNYIDASPFPLMITLYAMFGMCNVDMIKKGRISVTKQMVSKADHILEFLINFEKVPTNRRTEFCRALINCYKMEDVDNERLVNRVNSAGSRFGMISGIEDALGIIEEVYNSHARGRHVYIKTNYLKMLEERCGASASD